MSDKLDEMFGMLHEIKPVILDIRDGQKAMDIRVRAVENLGVEHKVRLARIDTDLDALGKKVRERPTIGPIGATGAAGADGSNWRGLMEFFSVLPTYWHVVVSIMMFSATVLVTAWKKRP